MDADILSNVVNPPLIFAKTTIRLSIISTMYDIVVLIVANQLIKLYLKYSFTEQTQCLQMKQLVGNPDFTQKQKKQGP